MEPVVTGISFAISKVYYGIAALFGGFMLSFFWMPDKLKEYTPIAAGAIIGGISAASGVIFGGWVAIRLGMDPYDANTALAVGGAIGIGAVGIIALIANTFNNRKNKDLLEVVTEIRQVAKPAAKKTSAKKVVRRKPAP